MQYSPSAPRSLFINVVGATFNWVILPRDKSDHFQIIWIETGQKAPIWSPFGRRWMTWTAWPSLGGGSMYLLFLRLIPSF